MTVFCITLPIILTSKRIYFLVDCWLDNRMGIPYILASEMIALVFTSDNLSLPPMASIYPLITVLVVTHSEKSFENSGQSVVLPYLSK